MKECRKCGERKELTEFRLRSDNGKYKNECKVCTTLYARKYQKDNSKDAWKRQIKYKYGITPSDYDRLYNEQEGKCLICKTHQSTTDKRLSIDHNHVTGEVRGLLCTPCNTGIGLLQDSPRLLLEAVNYLNTKGHYGE